MLVAALAGTRRVERNAASACSVSVGPAAPPRPAAPRAEGFPGARSASARPPLVCTDEVILEK